MNDGRKRNGLGLKTLFTLAGFVGITAVFSTLFVAAAPREAVAQRYPGQVRFQFRQTVIPGGDAAQFRVALWILNPVFGKLRLCLIDDPAAKASALKCSPWLGGKATPGRYGVQNIRTVRRFRRGAPPPPPGAVGIWLLNFTTGDAQVCLIGDLADPTGSLKCSESQ